MRQAQYGNTPAAVDSSMGVDSMRCVGYKRVKPCLREGLGAFCFVTTLLLLCCINIYFILIICLDSSVRIYFALWDRCRSQKTPTTITSAMFPRVFGFVERRRSTRRRPPQRSASRTRQSMYCTCVDMSIRCTWSCATVCHTVPVDCVRSVVCL